MMRQDVPSLSLRRGAGKLFMLLVADDLGLERLALYDGQCPRTIRQGSGWVAVELVGECPGSARSFTRAGLNCGQAIQYLFIRFRRSYFNFKIATKYYRAEAGRDCSSGLLGSSHRTRATIPIADISQIDVRMPP
jgi:hypothetical protein